MKVAQNPSWKRSDVGTGIATQYLYGIDRNSPRFRRTETPPVKPELQLIPWPTFCNQFTAKNLKLV